MQACNSCKGSSQLFLPSLVWEKKKDWLYSLKQVLSLAFSRLRATATGATSTIRARTATTGPLRSTQATPTTRTTSTSTAATTTRTTTTTVTTGTPSAPSQHPPFPGTRETLAGPALAALALQKRGNLSASAAHASAQPPHAPHTGGSISKFCPFPFWQHYRAALFSHLCRLS